MGKLLFLKGFYVGEQKLFYNSNHDQTPNSNAWNM